VIKEILEKELKEIEGPNANMTTGNKAFKVRHAWLEKKKGSNLQ